LNETPHVHHAAQRRGSRVAAGGAGTAAGAAGGRGISGQSSDADARNTAAFRKALNESGYVEGENVTVEYRWVEGQYNRLPALMADLVRREAPEAQEF
jgi:hypothetical protein